MRLRFIIILLLTFNSITYAQKNRIEQIYELSKGFSIYVENMSNKISLNVEINDRESYKDFIYGDIIFFRGILRKTYQLKTKTKTEETQIAGFYRPDFIEFGDRLDFEKAKDDNRYTYLKDRARYFDGRKISNEKRYKGTWYGFGLYEKAWINYEVTPIKFSYDCDNDFNKIVNISINNYELINDNPLTVKSNITLENKSLWFLDVESRSNIMVLGMSPEYSMDFSDIILNSSNPLKISFNGGSSSEGTAYLKNLCNCIWIGATGQPAPEINKILSFLKAEFGTTLLTEYLERNPQIVLEALTKNNLIPKQTTLEQFLKLQSFFGKLGGAVSIAGLILNAPNYVKAVEEWFIIIKHHECYLQIEKV